MKTLYIILIIILTGYEINQRSKLSKAMLNIKKLQETVEQSRQTINQNCGAIHKQGSIISETTNRMDQLEWGPVPQWNTMSPGQEITGLEGTNIEHKISEYYEITPTGWMMK